MASAEVAQESLPSKTIVLRVSIHCEGCKKKVRKVLNNIDGVYKCDVDSVQHKVTVIGNVEAETLIRRLSKSGKQAFLWPEPSPAPNPKANKDANQSKSKQQKQPKDQPDNSEKKQQAASTATTTDAGDSSEKKKPQEAAAAAAEPKPTNTESNKGNEKNSEKAETTQDSPASNEEEAAAAAGKKKNKKKKKQADDVESSTDAAEQVGTTTVEPITRSASLPVPEHMYPYGPMYAPPPLYRTTTQPAYVMSYNMAQPPAPSVTSYYSPHAQPMPTMPMPPPPPQQQQPEASGYNYNMHSPYTPAYYPEHTYMPYGGPSTDFFYGPPGSRSSSPPDSYRMFNDENPNSCNLM